MFIEIIIISLYLLIALVIGIRFWRDLTLIREVEGTWPVLPVVALFSLLWIVTIPMFVFLDAF